MNRDSLIDAAAREMTQYEPSPDFRARVLSRLDAPRRRRWLPVIASVAGVAAGVAALVVIWRPGTSGTITEPAATPMQVTASTTHSMETNPPSTDSALAPQADAAHSTATRQVSAEELAWQSRALPSLAVAPPMVIEPIQPSTLSITPIVVTPLVTEPLTVPPVDQGVNRIPSLPDSLIP